MDTGDRGICGGFAREFFFRVNEVYTGTRGFPQKGQECRVSLQIFEQMLAEVADAVTIVRGVAGLAGAAGEGAPHPRGSGSPVQLRDPGVYQV